MNKFFTTLLTLAALAIAMPVSAQDCTPNLSRQATVTIGDDEGIAFYIDNDECGDECLFSTWIYEESNGIKGLQRLDVVVDDVCSKFEHDAIEPDTMHF